MKQTTTDKIIFNVSVNRNLSPREIISASDQTLGTLPDVLEINGIKYKKI
jgi:hypothetical protein